MTESTTLTVIRGPRPRPGDGGEDAVDLTTVPAHGQYMQPADLAGLLGVLTPLRTWLDGHGALTPSSGVWVHISGPEGADSAPATGEVLGACTLTCAVQTH